MSDGATQVTGKAYWALVYIPNNQNQFELPLPTFET